MNATVGSIEDRMLKLQLRLAQLEKNELAQNNFLHFVHAMWPEFISGSMWKFYRLMIDDLDKDEKS